MEYRNPVFSRADETAIDMEINHPVHGWVPTTTTPNDVEQDNRELFAAALAAGNVAPYVPPEPPPPIAAIPAICCLANLEVADGEIFGIETAVGLSMAFMMDAGVAWIFFQEPFADLSYSWNVNATVGRANVSARSTDYLEITLTGDDGQPAGNTELAIQIFKVQ